MSGTRESAMAVPALHERSLIYVGSGQLRGLRGVQRTASIDLVDVKIQTEWTPWPRAVVTLSGPSGSDWGSEIVLNDNISELTLHLQDPVQTVLTLAPVFAGDGLLVCETTGKPADSNVAPVHEVYAHWLNCPWLDPQPPAITDGRSIFIGRSTWNIGNYAIFIDSSSDHEDRKKALRNGGNHGFTHAMRAVRVDGSTMPQQEVSELLEALSLAVSFAVGRFVAPCLRGSSDGGSPLVWEDSLVDHWQGTQSVWREHKLIKDSHLEHLVAAVTSAALDPERRETVRYVIQNFVNANNNRTFLEQSIMSSWAGLERLAWRRIVEESEEEDESKRARWAKKVDSQKTSDWRIRRLLGISSVSPELSKHSPVLKSFRRHADDPPSSDGAQAVKWVRDAVTHPTGTERTGDLGELLHETYLVAQDWLALSLLNWVGYNSQVFSIVAPGEPRHMVPWARQL
jgi:hypothetical protein